MSTHQHALAETHDSALTTPFSSAEEQAHILRVTAKRQPNDRPLQLDEAFSLEPWETRLLHSEAHSTQRARGLARTLLRARAAEWAVTRRLNSSTPLDSETTQAISVLLDQNIVDIGVTNEFATADDVSEGFEQIADRLASLYESVSDMSLRLLQADANQRKDLDWRLREATDDAFELVEGEPEPNQPSLEELLAAREASNARRSPNPEVADEPDPFELEQLPHPAPVDLHSIASVHSAPSHHTSDQPSTLLSDDKDEAPQTMVTASEPEPLHDIASQDIAQLSLVEPSEHGVTSSEPTALPEIESSTPSSPQDFPELAAVSSKTQSKKLLIAGGVAAAVAVIATVLLFL